MLFVKRQNTHTKGVFSSSIMVAKDVDIRGGIKRRRNFKWQLYL